MTSGFGPMLRQRWADLLATFWVRPGIMVAIAILLGETLVRTNHYVQMPKWLADWVYAGGVAGARDVLGAIASATIGVAGTTFSITVAALTLASNQMGPRLLRNFTRDPGNGYALGALLATFAYSLVTLRSVPEAEEGAHVPQIAVSLALILAFACVGVLVWFIHHIATSISVDRVVALVHADLAAAIAELPKPGETEAAPDRPEPPEAEGAPLQTPEGGYLRVLDDEALADWAVENDATLRLRPRPGDFVFPGSSIGTVWPRARGPAAQEALAGFLILGNTRSAEQDIEFLIRQLVEIALRALSPGVNDPFTAIAVLDRLGAALCDLVGRRLPDGCTRRDGQLRVRRGATDYAGLVDAMFHMLRQASATNPGVTIRLLEVLAEVVAVEHEPGRRVELLRHVELARDAIGDEPHDASVTRALTARRDLAREGTATPDRG